MVRVVSLGFLKSSEFEFKTLEMEEGGVGGGRGRHWKWRENLKHREER